MLRSLTLKFQLGGDIKPLQKGAPVNFSSSYGWPGRMKEQKMTTASHLWEPPSGSNSSQINLQNFSWFLFSEMARYHWQTPWYSLGNNLKVISSDSWSAMVNMKIAVVALQQINCYQFRFHHKNIFHRKNKCSVLDIGHWPHFIQGPFHKSEQVAVDQILTSWQDIQRNAWTWMTKQYFWLLSNVRRIQTLCKYWNMQEGPITETHTLM